MCDLIPRALPWAIFFNPVGIFLEMTSFKKMSSLYNKNPSPTKKFIITVPAFINFVKTKSQIFIILTKNNIRQIR